MANFPEKIKRSWVSEKVSFSRAVDNSKFYNSWTWRKFRKFYINRNPLCVVCLAVGVDTIAKVVDHIIPIALGGEKLKENNVQSMCTVHHNSKSGEEAHVSEKIRV